MNVIQLRANDAADVMNLFCESFYDDPYYSDIFSEDKRLQKMREVCYPSIKYCLDNGYCIGIKENEELVAFLLGFDYSLTKNRDYEAINLIFAGSRDASSLPYKSSLHASISALDGTVFYCVSIAVKPQFRSKGLASGLIDYAMHKHSDAYYVSDVSNSGSLVIYERRNFEITQIDDEYYLVIHSPKSDIQSCSFEKTVNLILPDTLLLHSDKIPFEIKKESVYILDSHTAADHSLSVFRYKKDSVAEGVEVTLSYSDFLKYQRLINVSHFSELFSGISVYYLQQIPYSSPPLMNTLLEDMVKTRANEWNIVPDIFISIPVQYTSPDLLENNLFQDDKASLLLKDLDFRTHYEAGIPAGAKNVDDKSSFKSRIKRFYLGKLLIQISSEVTVDHYDKTGDPIGAPALTDMYISIDQSSNCGVLTLYSLSAPFLFSHLLDNTIRNQISVIWENEKINLFEYLNDKHGIIKRGSPKVFTVIPEDKNCLTKSQTASLLAAETIYPDGENFGGIIDSEILSAISSENGMGQYDRAYVCAYTNVAIQFTPDFRASLKERLCEESITLFYIELILLEEAAIHIADKSIINLLASEEIIDPVKFLGEVDVIYDEYFRTIDFWDIKVNYPTSQKSINMLRDAFKLKEQLEYLHRNQNQLQIAFDTKCDIVDRKDSRRMDTSLAIISFLAVFSAWMDGHSYLETWEDVFSAETTLILQRILFAIVFVTAGYAISRLFGNKVKIFLSRIFGRKKQKKK